MISQTSYHTYKIISSYELARPVMGTIFLVYNSASHGYEEDFGSQRIHASAVHVQGMTELPVDVLFLSRVCLGFKVDVYHSELEV